ncbi:MAG TPA: hypothetical protein VJU61_27675, partial [Polyangiaceae bacterium]|nr:hypothetical protein [Polyangiaceae bacterium]
HAIGKEGERLPGHNFWNMTGAFLFGILDTNEDGIVDAVDVLNLASPFGNLDEAVSCPGA